MSIRQNIYDLCVIAEESRVPVLLLSNPGYAKTTCIESYANERGYYLETLVGSRYSAEDISGYQVNEPGKTSLVHKNPSWFQRIWDKHNEGKRTMLFIDELSTCNDNVQGTLLTLIFDRTIGENKFLPEDTVIMSAANYANNLNDQFDLLSPTINRFCVINLTEGISDFEIIDEFLSDKYLKADIHDKPVVEDLDKNFVKKSLHDKIKSLLSKYSQTNSSNGKIDLHNTDIQDLYRRNDNLVLNVMTGRSLSYLGRVLSAMIKFGIRDTELIGNVADGLIGNGSCSFKEESQLNYYRNEIKNICNDIVMSVKHTPKDVEIDDDLGSEITRFINFAEGKNNAPEDIEDFRNSLFRAIKNKYGDPVKVFNDFNKKGTDKIRMNFITFMDLYLRFIPYLKSDAEDFTDACGLHQRLLPIYNDISGTDFVIKDFNDTYGYCTPKFVQKVMFSEDENGNVIQIGMFDKIKIKLIGKNPSDSNLGNLINNDLCKKELHLIKLD